MSARINYLTTRDRRTVEQPRRTLGQALAERRPAWLRIHVQHDRAGGRRFRLDAWTTDFRMCDDPGTTVQQLRDAHPEINWWRSHDIDVATGAVYATPEPHEDGWLPDKDRTFGDRRAPALVDDRGWLDTVTTMPARRAA